MLYQFVLHAHTKEKEMKLKQAELNKVLEQQRQLQQVNKYIHTRNYNFIHPLISWDSVYITI